MILELIGILAGIAIFIFSIEELSRELLNFSREKLKDIIQKFTDKPIKGLFTGIIVTALIQSSTATTSILITLVDAGLISFTQSLGVIAGAHIGTTLTAQLVAFKFTAFAPLFVIVGFIISFLQKYKLIGKSIFLFGLIFYALSIISSYSYLLKDSELFTSTVLSLDNPLSAIFTGIILTVILQSSSIVTALTVLFAMDGLIPVSLAIPLVLGSNIGTTSTALIVSRNMSIFAKRTALAHILFAITGVILIYPFLNQFTSYVVAVSANEGAAVANAHTLFNIMMAIPFILFAGFFAKLIESVLPSKEKELIFKPKYINKLPKDTKLALTKIRLELINHLRLTKEMFDIATDMFATKDSSKMPLIQKYGSLSDYLDSRITSALVAVSQRNLSEKESKEVIALSKIANQIERLADLAEDYAYVNVKLENNNLEFSKESLRDILKIKISLDEIYDTLFLNFNHINKNKVNKILSIRKDIDNLISLSHKLRIQLLSKEKIGTYSTVLFIDAIASFEEAASILVRIARNAKTE